MYGERPKTALQQEEEEEGTLPLVSPIDGCSIGMTRQHNSSG